MDESGDEQETEGIVNQVLDEIGIEISGKVMTKNNYYCYKEAFYCYYYYYLKHSLM